MTTIQLKTVKADGDECLLLEAAAVVITQQKARTTLIQRHVRVGFAKALRLLELLNEAGVIGPPPSYRVLVPATAQTAALDALRILLGIEPPSPAQTCKGCQGTKLPGRYLCHSCWHQLPDATQRALSRKDGLAARRLSDLHDKLRAGTPLDQIEVTP